MILLGMSIFLGKAVQGILYIEEFVDARKWMLRFFI